MLISEKRVFVVGFRKSDDDAWVESGVIMFNRIDAEYKMKTLQSLAPKFQYRVFESDRFK